MTRSPDCGGALPDPSRRRWSGRWWSARLNIITHLLGQIPYEDLPRDKVELALIIVPATTGAADREKMDRINRIPQD
jgi:hypothetical protein